MTQFQKNAWTERQREAWRDGQTLFYRALMGTAGGPKRREAARQLFL